MKNLIFLIAFIIVWQSKILSQEEWLWQNPLPQGNHIRSIISLDEDNIVAAGLKGFFIKSTDSGLNWEISFHGENTFLTELKYFSSANYLFALALDFSLGTILYKSEDLGISWDSTFTFNNLYIKDLDRNSEDVFYAIGSSGKIFKSSDDGYNWQSVSSPVTVTLSAIQFFDNQHACIIGNDGIILRTSDNGNNWSIIQSGVTEDFAALDFLDSMNGIAVGQNWSQQVNTILMTTDGGVNWINKVVSDTLDELLDVEFIDLQDIIIVGGNDDYFGGREPIVIRSNDGGENWIDLSSQFPRGLNSISFYNSNNAICAGYSGGIYKTTDSGYNWTKIYSGFFSYFNDICTFDSSFFYTIGKDFEADELVFLFTDNGGEVWETKNVPPLTNVAGLDFLNENYGMISGDNLIFYTENGCSIWHQGTTPPNSYFAEVDIVSSDKAFLSGGQGTLLKSTDGGSTWFSINSNTTGNLERIIFKDLLNGLIIANSGPSIITTDGGENWNTINYSFDWLKDGVFYGNNNIALASYGKIYISNDGGQTWTEKIVAGTGTYISGISFKDALNGTAVGETGLILFTTDGGDTWHQQFSPTLIDLSGIKYSHNGCGIIIGKDGVILGTKKGIQIVEVDDEEENLFPTSLYLSQNYPNPFNPSTKISWQSPVGGWQTLKVYDVLGNEVATLVDEYKPAGTYEVEFNASALTSGVYFYQLLVSDLQGKDGKTENYIETKKMILLK